MTTLSAEELYQKGERYLRGDGVKADIKKAAEYFEQAINIGNLPEAKRELGYILLGNGLLHTDASNLDGLSAEIERHKRGELLLEEAASEGDILAKKWFIKKPIFIQELNLTIIINSYNNLIKYKYKNNV